MAGMNSISYNHKSVGATQTKSAHGQAKAESTKANANQDLLKQPGSGDQVSFSNQLQLDDQNYNTSTGDEMQPTSTHGKGKAQTHGKGKAAEEDDQGEGQDAGQDKGGGKAGGHGKGHGHGKDKSCDRIPPGLAKKHAADLPDGNPWKAALKKREEDAAAQEAQGADETQATDEAPDATPAETQQAETPTPAAGETDSRTNSLLALLLQLLTSLMGKDEADQTDDTTPEVATETDAQGPAETTTPAQIAVGEPVPGTDPEALPVVVTETDDQATADEAKPVDAEVTEPVADETKPFEGDPMTQPPADEVPQPEEEW
jgi:hypothetical protein